MSGGSACPGLRAPSRSRWAAWRPTCAEQTQDGGRHNLRSRRPIRERRLFAARPTGRSGYSGENGREPLQESDVGVKQARGPGGEHVPLVSLVGCRVTPGAGFERPLALYRSTLEEQAGGLVEADGAEAGRTPAELGGHVERHVQRSGKRGEVHIAHGARKRDVKQSRRAASLQRESGLRRGRQRRARVRHGLKGRCVGDVSTAL